jgi:hypothetical protein
MIKKENKLPKNPETKEIRDACAVLSLQNQKRAYEVACALKFAEHPTQFPAEEKPVTAAGVSRAGTSGEAPCGDGDRRRGMTSRNRE